MRSSTSGLLAALVLGSVSTSQAADLDYGTLRGEEYEPTVQVIDWSGFYIGAHGGYTSAGLSQTNVLQSTLANYFRARDIETEFHVSDLIAIPASRARGATYGAFAGYNLQFDDVVLGVEADYTHFGGANSATADIGRIFTTAAGLSETVALDGKSSTTIEDYGTVRGRAGYAIGDFLPFITGGLAVGRITIDDSVKAQNYGYDAKTYAANQAGGTNSFVYSHGYDSFNPRYPAVGSSPAHELQTAPSAPINLTAGPRSKTVGGAALGAGIEYAITPNILLRGEYQYVLFQDFNGHKAELNTVRGGAAVKF